MTSNALMFEATDASLTIDTSASGSESLTITVSLSFSSVTEVFDSSGCSLRDAIWALLITNETTQIDEERIDHFGTLHFVTSKSDKAVKSIVCMFKVFQPKRAFLELLSSLRSGKLPTSIAISTDGMEKANGALQWNTQVTPSLSVTGLSLDLPLIDRLPIIDAHTDD